MSTSTILDRQAAVDVAIRSMQIMVDGEMADFEAIVHPAAINRESVTEPPATRVSGPIGFYATAQWLRAMFADLSFEIHDAVIDGDLVAVHNTMSGRHVGPAIFYSSNGDVDQVMPPTGKEFATTQSHWLRIHEDQVIEHWANRDDHGMAVQLGWVPPSPWYLLRMMRATRRAKAASR